MALNYLKRNVSETENKLRLLFCMKQIGFCSAEQLWPFVAELNLMEYIPFRLLMAELRDGGEISGGSNAVEGLLFLTAKGEETLRLFSPKLLPADCDAIREKAPAFAGALRQNRQVSAGYEAAAAEGGFGMYGRVRECDLPTLEFHYAAASQQRCTAAVETFRRNAAELLRLLYLYPVREGGSDGIPVVRPGESAESAPFLVEYGAEQYGVCIALNGHRERCRLTLLLNGRQYSENWGLTAQNDPGLLGRIGELLCGEALP